MIYKNVNATNLTQDVHFYWNLKNRSGLNELAETSVETKSERKKNHKRAENSHRIHLNVVSKAHSNTHTHSELALRQFQPHRLVIRFIVAHHAILC